MVDSWTTPRTWVDGETENATVFNPHVRDNLDYLKARQAESAAAWTAYTPSLGNWIVGNGSLVGRYRQVGKTIDYSIVFTIGSTTIPHATFPLTFNLPVPCHANLNQLLVPVTLWDTPGSPYAQWASMSPGSPSSLLLGLFGATGVRTSWVTATTPFTWTAGDSMIVAGTYEAA